MSRFLLCAVLDEAVGRFAPPMSFRTKAEAIRSFSDAAIDKNSALYRHPTDYVLYHIGSYDDSSGICDSISPLVRIVSAAECIPVEVAAAAS